MPTVQSEAVELISDATGVSNVEAIKAAQFGLDDCILKVWKYARKYGNSLDREHHCNHLRQFVDDMLTKAAITIASRDAEIASLKSQLKAAKPKTAKKTEN